MHLGKQFAHEFLALVSDAQYHAPAIGNAGDAGNQSPIDQRIADARQVRGALRGANTQIAGMGDALRLGEQGGQNTKLSLRETERSNLLFEVRRHFTADMQHQAAEQNAVHRQVGHSLLEAPQVSLHQLELSRYIIHLYANYLIVYILPSEYMLRKYLP